ncbi:hypothetical protein [Lacinutrix sp.]|uniref:hypothetical protein n=1 Tax=Lacinutrix sp. TaxID=1937692 RepID=UPI0025BF6C76|nr:hypothetical protein [Lacinutrix sp.]
MKHIKRKFLLTHNIEEESYKALEKALGNPNNKREDSNENMVPHLITTNNELIQAFFYNLNGTKVQIPEPNPIVIYFSNAQGFLMVIKEQRKKLFKELELQDYNIGNVLNLMFGFYGCVVNYSSSLFDSLEAFVNSKIPMEYKYTNPKRKKKTMDKFKIIRYLSFEDKVKFVFPEIYSGKNFVKEKSHLYENLKKLLELRNNITHAKSDLNYDVNYYEKLFIQTLDFDYEKSIESAKDFINFYDENLIEPCNCGLKH